MSQGELKALKADLSLLLECIKYQLHNVNAVTQALITISKSCSTGAVGQDILRENGGLQYIDELWISTSHVQVRNAAMFCLACATDKNVYSQKLLCTSDNFSHLYKLLSDPQLETRTTHAAMFFLLSLMSNNSTGQTLLRKSNCLEKILNLFNKTSPAGSDVWLDDLNSSSLDLWSAVTSVLSTSVNNPQNDENQRACAMIFPQSLQMLQDHCEPAVVRPLASFIGLAVANNFHNQTLIERCSGLEVLVSCLHRAVNRCKQDEQYLELAVCLVGTVDSIIADNAKNAEQCVALGVIPLFLQLLSENIEENLKLQVVLALGHCTEICVTNQINLVQNGGLGILIQQLSFAEDEEFSKSVRYVLQTCVNIDKKALQSHPSQVKQKYDSEMSLLKGLAEENDQLWPSVSEHTAREDSLTLKLKELENKLNSAEEENLERCRLFSIESSNALIEQNRESLNKKGARGREKSPKYTLDLTNECDLESLASLKFKRRKSNQHQKIESKSNGPDNVVEKSSVEKQLLTKVEELEKKLKQQKRETTMTPEVEKSAKPGNKHDSRAAVVPVIDENMQKRLDVLEQKLEQHCNSQDSKVNTTESSKSTDLNLQKVKRKLILDDTVEREDQKYRKLELELQKERSLRLKLEAEAVEAKRALEQRRKEESEAARRAQLLAEELLKQQMEQEEADLQLEKQVEESIKEHERLLHLKEEKENELQNIERELEKLRCFAEETGIELTSPLSIQSVQSVISKQPTQRLPAAQTSTPLLHDGKGKLLAGNQRNTRKVPTRGTNTSNQKSTPKTRNSRYKEAINKEEKNVLKLLSVNVPSIDELVSNRITHSKNKLNSDNRRKNNFEYNDKEESENSERDKYIADELKTAKENKTLKDRNRPDFDNQKDKENTILKELKPDEYNTQNTISVPESKCNTSSVIKFNDKEAVFLIPNVPPKRRRNSNDIKMFQESQLVNKRGSTYSSTDIETDDSSVRLTPKKLRRKHLESPESDQSMSQNSHIDIGQGDGPKINIKNGCNAKLITFKKQSPRRPSPSRSIQSDFDFMLMKTAMEYKSLRINSPPNSPVKGRRGNDKNLTNNNKPLKTPVGEKNEVIGLSQSSSSPLSSPVKEKQDNEQSHSNDKLLKTPVSLKNIVVGLSPSSKQLRTPLSVKRRNHPLLYSPKTPSVIKVVADQCSSAKRTLNLGAFATNRIVDERNVDNIEDGVQPLEEEETEDPAPAEDGPAEEEEIVPDSEEHDSENPPQNSQATGVNRCPGCQPPDAIGYPLLNSHNYNIALETNPYTCPKHRELRQQERQLIYDLKKNNKVPEKGKRLFDRNNNGNRDTQRQNSQKSNKDVYEFTSSSGEEGNLSENETDASLKLSPLRSPPVNTEDNNVIQSNQINPITPNGKVRRTRIPYTKQEEFNLTHGVEHMGKFWKQILNTYEFHESRTAADLMEKYKRMNYKKKTDKSLPSSPRVQPDPQNPNLSSTTQQHPLENNPQQATSSSNLLVQPPPQQQLHQPFAMAEDRRLSRGVKLYGNNWAVILHSFQFSKNRTAPELRERWRTLHKQEKRDSTDHT